MYVVLSLCNLPDHDQNSYLSNLVELWGTVEDATKMSKVGIPQTGSDYQYRNCAKKLQLSLVLAYSQRPIANC